MKHTFSNPEKKLNPLICTIIHNRDKNAIQNMLYIVEHIKKTGLRPEAYTRKELKINSSLAHKVARLWTQSDYPCKTLINNC